MYKQEFQFLLSALRLVMLNISIKFHESILTVFHDREWTQIYHSRISKGNNSKTVLTSITVLVCCTSPDDALYLYEVFKL